MNGLGNTFTSNIYNVLFYIFIILAIAFIVFESFRICVLKVFFDDSTIESINSFFGGSKNASSDRVKDEVKVVNNNIKRENFNSSKQIIFTAYTADWCPHCVTFKNESYGKLQNYFSNNSNIKITNVDCTNDNSGNTKTRAGNSLQGFPTLVINTVTNGKMNEEMYEGSRDANAIISYLKNL
jgi:thiol:disulfide interchange protein